MGRLSGLVKQNTSQRGTEYTCHQCEQKFSRTQLIRHLSVSHILWMEQAGYSGKELKLGNCKNRFLFAVMSLCDPELLIEQVILKNENFPAGRLAIPLRRKEAPTGSQKKNPLEKKCHQLKEEMARLDQHLEEQKLKLRMLEEREVELRSGIKSKGRGDGPGYGFGQQNYSSSQEGQCQSKQWVESNLPGTVWCCSFLPSIAPEYVFSFFRTEVLAGAFCNETRSSNHNSGQSFSGGHVSRKR